MARVSITIYLSPAEYAKLESAASARKLTPAKLVLTLVTDHLQKSEEESK